jgi:hypothetical protein
VKLVLRFNEVVDRLVAYMFANSYPGTYQLGSSSPGGTYDTHLAAIFSDTRTDGTTVAYNIYQVQSLAVPPSAVRPIKLNDASGNLKEMSDAEIKLTFGQRVKTRIMAAANGIGAYQLRTSGEGVPVATGTWVAKGTATDTRNTTADANYSADYSAGYDGTYSAVYSANYQRIGQPILLTMLVHIPILMLLITQEIETNPDIDSQVCPQGQLCRRLYW